MNKLKLSSLVKDLASIKIADDTFSNTIKEVNLFKSIDDNKKVDEINNKIASLQDTECRNYAKKIFSTKLTNLRYNKKLEEDKQREEKKKQEQQKKLEEEQKRQKQQKEQEAQRQKEKNAKQDKEKVIIEIPKVAE